jgi:hypothetical protein
VQLGENFLIFMRLHCAIQYNVNLVQRRINTGSSRHFAMYGITLPATACRAGALRVCWWKSRAEAHFSRLRQFMKI